MHASRSSVVRVFAVFASVAATMFVSSVVGAAEPGPSAVAQAFSTLESVQSSIDTAVRVQNKVASELQREASSVVDALSRIGVKPHGEVEAELRYASLRVHAIERARSEQAERMGSMESLVTSLSRFAFESRDTKMQQKVSALKETITEGQRRLAALGREVRSLQDAIVDGILTIHELEEAGAGGR